MLTFNNNSRFENTREKHFDILISALGYESRCVHIAQALNGNYTYGFCLEFPDRKVLAYSDNKAIYESLKFRFELWNNFLDQSNLLAFINEILESISAEQKILSIAVDISSMNRKMVAELFYILNNHMWNTHIIEISILYAPAIYTEPEPEILAMKNVGPVIQEYSGWFTNPSDPLYAVIGLGYENGKAIGALEYLDAASAWLLKPLGKDKQFEDQVIKENHDLIAMVGENKVLTYNLSDPYDTFIKIRSLTEGLIKNGRIVFLPFGPKLFNAICIITTHLYDGDIAVWRVSAGEEEKPVDHKANGDIISFTYLLDTLTFHEMDKKE